MGAAPRIKPKHLARQLRRIRLALGLSQSDMLRRLGYEGVIAYYRISNYELGTGEPPLPVLLEYARLAGVSTDVLIDDKAKLPANIPAKPKR